MPRRLETQSEMAESHMIKTAGRLEDIQKQIRQVEQQRAQVKEKLDVATDPAEQQQYQRFLMSYAEQIRQLRSQMTDLLSSGEEQLTYQQLRTLKDDLGFQNEPFEPQKNIYVGPSEGEGPAEGVSFYPSQLEKDLGLPRSDRLRKRDDLIDFDSAKQLLYPGVATEDLTDLQIEEIKSKMIAQQEDVAGYAQEKLLEQKQREQQKERQQEQKEDFAQRSIIRNEIWKKLEPGTGGEVAPAGRLDEVEEKVLISMLPTASKDFETYSELHPSGPQWEEFMQDLFNIVQTNRNNVAVGKVRAEYNIPKESRERVNPPSELGTLNVSIPEIRKSETKEEHFQRVVQEFENAIRRGEAFLQADQKRIDSIQSQLDSGVDSVGRQIEPAYPDGSYAPGSYGDNLQKELKQRQLSSEKTQKSIEWYKNAIQQAQSNKEIPSAPQEQVKRFEQGGPKAVYRPALAEGLTIAIRQLAEKYPELNIQEGMRSIIQEAPVREKRFDPLPQAAQIAYDLFADESADVLTEDLDEEEVDRRIKEIEDATRPTPFSPFTRAQAKGIFQSLFPSGIPALGDSMDDEMTLGDEELAPSMEDEIGMRLDTLHQLEVSEVTDQIRNIKAAIKENPNFANAIYGNSVLDISEDGIVALNTLTSLPGGEFIENWIRANNNLDVSDVITKDMLPTNSQAQGLLRDAEVEMNAEYFLARGDAKDIKSSEYPEFREKSLARRVVRSSFGPKPLGAGKDREQQAAARMRRDSIDLFGKSDPAYQRDLNSWLSITIPNSEGRDGSELTPNQMENAKTYYTYDWWFTNVYDRSGGEKTLDDRIERLKDPKILEEEEKRYAPPSLEDILEKTRKMQDQSPDDMYTWMDEYKVINQMIADMGIEDTKQIKGELRAQKEQLLLQKVAQFMKYDPETRGIVMSRSRVLNLAEGQLERGDAAPIIWDFIASSIVKSRTGSLSLFERYVQENILKELQKVRQQGLVMQEDPDAEQTVDAEGEILEKPEDLRQQDLDDLMNDALRKFVFTLAKPAMSDAFRKGTRRLKSMRMTPLLGNESRGEVLNQSFEDFIARQTETDPQNAIKNFDEAMTDRISEVTERSPEEIDSSMMDMVEGFTMKKFWVDFKRALTPNQRQEFEFFFGPTSSRDIYKEGQTPDGSEFMTLDTANAEREWRRVFGSPLSASRIGQKKRKLDLLMKYAIYREANSNPDFLKILNETIALQKEMASEEFEEFKKQYPTPSQEMEEGYQQSENVSEKKTTNVSKLYRIKSLRKNLEKE